MKIKCFYKIYNMLYRDRYDPYAEIINQEKYNINYSRYLLSYLIFTSLEEIKLAIEEIKKIEVGKITETETLVEMPDIYLYIYAEKTLFEHNQEYWEEWECPTKIVKRALEEWKKFLEMPINKDTTYEFEIPDSDL